MDTPWFPEAGKCRAVLIGTSTYGAADLTAIPAVANNLAALRDALTDPTTGLFSAEHCAVEGLDTPTSLAQVGMALGRAAREATDLLVVYYAGHGLLDDDGSLHLGLEDTEPQNVGYSGLPIARIKQDLGQARARARVLILDCCFSGQAIAAMATPSSLVTGQLTLTGTYTLTSSSANVPSHAPAGARHTAFTGALLSALAEPEPRTLDEIYQHVHGRLVGLGLPAPQRRATNTAGRLALVRGASAASGDSASEPETEQAVDPPPVSSRTRTSTLARVLVEAGASPAKAPEVRRRPGASPPGSRPTPGTDADRAAIVEFWSTVEMFSPQPVKKVNRRERVTSVVPGEPLPWDPDHELARYRLTSKQAWRHTVYLGVYQLEPVFDFLNSVFPPDEMSYDERPAGESALAAFVVSGTGRPLVDSQVLSSCAWATGRVLNPGPDEPGWLSGFERTRNDFAALFEDLVTPGRETVREARQSGRVHEVGNLADEELLAGCFRLVEDLVRLASVVPHGEIRVHSQIVAKRNAFSVDGHDFLNSMIADDLVAVAASAARGGAGAALRDYLRPDAEVDLGARVDVRDRPDAVLHATSPGQIPLGRWPSSPDHSLALGQQLAVTSAVRPRDGAGRIFAVNGPPGTGKTTMLRDLVAALVVERAGALAGLNRPDDAFAGTTETWLTGDYKRVIHLLRPQLTGFEMVVGSANNGAVENVTNEMPAREAIDDHWRRTAEEIDYFAGTASALLATDNDPANRGSQQVDEEEGGWALLTARLGNKANRSRFVDAFWFRTPPKQTAGANDGAPKDDEDEDATAFDHAQAGLLAILKDYERTTPSETWPEAVAEFNRALERAEAGQTERDRVYRTWCEKPEAEKHLRQCQEELSSAGRQLDGIRAPLAEANSRVQAWYAEGRRLTGLRIEHQRFRPGFLEWLTSWGRALREWRNRDSKLAGELTAAERAFDLARQVAARLANEASTAAGVHARAKTGTERAQHALNTLLAELTGAEVVLGPHFPDRSWFEDRSRRELTALWTDSEWNSARTDLFLAALRLHKAFLRHVPTKMRQSLQGAMDVLSGSAPRDLSQNAALAAWQALFLVVPVVSTTFSSFARMFSHLGAETLGWLLIDEAGQATPQSAVGALWRAKRAVIVGDPLQLEPITTVPFRAEQAIRRELGVDEQWLPGRTSVQRVADRLTHLGTLLPSDDGKIWVGAPLTVHRRCDEPMFGIANDIAYDGLMIHGNTSAHADRFTEEYPSLPESKWIDVATSHSEGHWIPAEGQQLDRILAALGALDFDMSDVMVIAPFRDVADRVRRRSDRYPDLVAGTIHTAQGKQADVVVLVLGSDPQRPGARRWAASKPNLLNVAASRAKRRLYVIGDRRAWSSQRHFDVLATRLPFSAPR
ncbi:AAA domain-containing protein [Amycolatopsis sp. DSM 110486]|uniref:caspase, EACC1-associated type n=1 Tax=Amycolatopsis sp. DSM 110486 TaxID=2865832 RepID=UPI001C6A22F9|nr:AAA domain-containing protein [Amycolatopsis sp. DSM 110486]QYN18876.1 caspase family protein [Amycolatopsis sp. DSM 110486]